ncbi:MAG: methyltransferase type 11, partial [Emticicia sp.]
PMQDLPKNIKDVKLQWIFGNGYYVLDFKKTKKAPTVNVNLPIPNKDFVDNWKLRAIKNRKTK